MWTCSSRVVVILVVRFRVCSVYVVISMTLFSAGRHILFFLFVFLTTKQKMFKQNAVKSSVYYIIYFCCVYIYIQMQYEHSITVRLIWACVPQPGRVVP